MQANRCAAHCRRCHAFSRRELLIGASAASAAFLTGCGRETNEAAAPDPKGGPAPPAGPAVAKVKPCGPASTCTPRLHACFVRRKEDYGMWWPGAVYDGEAARKKYTRLLRAAAKDLGLKLTLRQTPIYSLQEADTWLAEAGKVKSDGLVVVLLDRQKHAWPTANKAIDSKIPTVVFSPVGSSFTTNTAGPSKKPGCFICSTDDFSQVEYGLKMLHAGAKLRATRCLVIKGSRRADRVMEGIGMQFRTIPARAFLDEYAKTAETAEVTAMAEDYLRRARRRAGATRQDVLNGVRSYVVARTLLQREQADAITMDCLGALARRKVALPCIAWSKMNDHGVPAACEADLGAAVTQTIVQYLFDRPGFQQDPVAETARGAIIGAHCSCPTRLRGFSKPGEPFDIVHHHANRDATARTIWRVGQRVTSADVLPGRRGASAKMIISAGEVLANVSVPPAGGCVVSVMVRFDGVRDVLAYPGFHHIFFYGDYKARLVQFCRLFGIEPMVV